MKVAVGQFIVGAHWRINAEQSIAFMRQAVAAGADLCVLPEAILARSLEDADHAVKSAQTLDGPFITLLREESRLSQLTTVFTIHTPTDKGRAANTLVALRCGEIVACYHKLHLYDAFSVQESRLVDPGDTLAPVIDVAGMAVGLMTCYDLRFPDIALSLALRGAQAIALPAAWLKGLHKEMHWQTLLSARALDTTCYMIASGECGVRNIGQSRIVDPLGLTLAESGSGPGIIVGQVTCQRVAEVRAQLPVLANRRFSVPQLIANKNG